MEVFIRFFVAQDALGDLKEATEFDQRWDAGTDRRLEILFTDPSKTKRTKPRFVCDTEQVIALGEGADGAALAFGKTALGALHEAPPPSIRR